MRSYRISTWTKDLKPEIDVSMFFRRNLDAIEYDDVRRFVSMWVTESTPNGFKDIPIIYEHIREDVAERLSVDVKDVNITGSAKIGFSLNPKSFGRKFSEGGSDLDFFIVNKEAFGKMVNEFVSWKESYTGDILRPNEHEKKYWDDNLRSVDKGQIERGFIRDDVVPARSAYAFRQRVHQLRGNLKQKINDTMNRRFVDKCSFRFYADWRSAIGQMTVNVNSAINKYRGSNCERLNSYESMRGESPEYPARRVRFRDNFDSTSVAKITQAIENSNSPDFFGCHKIIKCPAGTGAGFVACVDLSTGYTVRGPEFSSSIDYKMDSNVIVCDPKEEALLHFDGSVTDYAKERAYRLVGENFEELPDI